METTLVVMAAGMGSRFGGLKQVEPIGFHGESIADFSIYDARKVGFSKVVFVIKREIEEIFKEKVFNRIAKNIDAECVFQEIENIPAGFDYTNRTKPWGTGQAIICCRNAIKGNFAVVNADDFYGFGAFEQLQKFLTDPVNAPDTARYCMAGYKLGKTLTENGTVARGICIADDENYLTKIDEMTKIHPIGNKIVNDNEDSTYTELHPDAIASMNAWGFTRRVFAELEEGFAEFLTGIGGDPKAEYFLSYAVGEMLAKKSAAVKVLPCDERWYGFTYKEDLETVKDALRGMIDEGKYPENLWNGA